MTEKKPSGRTGFFRSIVFKNILLFLFILLVAVVPLAFRYYQDSRDYEIKVLASRLEFFAERGATWLDPEGIHTMRSPADKQTEVYQDTFQALSRIEKEFEVDNAVVMRRREDSSFEYVAVGGNAFRGSSPSSGGVANPCSPAAGNNPCSATGSRSISRTCGAPPPTPGREPVARSSGCLLVPGAIHHWMARQNPGHSAPP